jgi:formylglycine-generating enzyme required for sulfatase activity
MTLNERISGPRCALALAATLAPLAAQSPAPAPAQEKPAAAAPAIPTEGLPTFLLPVPAGKVQIGMTIDQLVEAASQAMSPRRPELALRDSEREKLARNLRNTASQLGQETRDVPAFLLGKWPVKNREYKAFLEKMAESGKKARPPFHWWRYGRKDDYDQKLADIAREFKADGKLGPIYFWERYGETLPWALKDDAGKPIDDQPVVYVSRRDAIRFAGFLGMRLPTEIEWTRAARGDGTNVWPWGQKKELGDKFQEQILGLMKLENNRDRVLKPVGTVEFNAGPFGHVDMTGQVWQFVGGTGFGPITGQKAFGEEWKNVQKHKYGSALKNVPAWEDDRFLVKGGSFLSSGDPVQLQIDCRFPVQDTEVLEAIGLRLAKSLKPGYDLLVSLVSSDYNQDLFAVGSDDQKVDFDAQMGVERYVLAEDGFPKEYHAVSFAPVDWITPEKNATVQKLEERSMTTPVLLGTLAITDPCLEPKLTPGIYSVAYRQKGMPKELKDAIKAGYKEVQNELKKKEREGKEKDKPEEGAAEPEVKKADWRGVIARYGITEKDLEVKGADTELKFVRLGTLEVPTETDLYVYFDNQGKWVASSKAGGLVAGNEGPTEVLFGTGKADKTEHAKVTFKAHPPVLKDQKKAVDFTLDLLLEQAPPAAGEIWRLPAAPATGGK